MAERTRRCRCVESSIVTEAPGKDRVVVRLAVGKYMRLRFIVDRCLRVVVDEIF